MTSMDIDSPTTPILAITPVMLPDNNEAPISEEQPNKRRRKKSVVWEHFTIETVSAGCMRACCKQCKKSFAYITGSKLAGTSHLKRHIALGICPVSRQKNEASQMASGVKTDPPRRRYRATPVLGSAPFDSDRCNQEIAKMIIQHEYPLHIVEHPAFIDFVRTLQPQYNMPSFNTIQGECVTMYLKEKQYLLNLISGIPGRVSLTLDLGTSNLNIGYAFLMGHFIDNDWNLHRLILNVIMLPFPDSDYAFNQAVVSCISDWNLESRLFTLTLDHSFSNENITGNLRELLSVKNPHMLNGQLLKGNCYARVLSRLAQDALGAMREVINRIRESVKYVKTSETHDEKFAELRQQLQVPSTKELIIDDQTKWSTTYQMLVAACELKEVFACLDTSDPVYKINPSMDDWKQVEILCTYLKLFYDAASLLTAPAYPPANAFYHEVSKVQLELTHAAMSQDPFVSNLTKPLKEKFDQYWRDCFLVLAIAVVMDPRFKMKLVEFSFSKIFGEDAGMWIKTVDDGMHELFLEYLAPNLSISTSFMEAQDMGIPRSEILQEVHPKEVAPQEAHFEVPLQVAHPANSSPEEFHSQGAALQNVNPEELTPHVHSKHEPPGEASHQMMHHHEVPQQEMHPQEVSMQEMKSRGIPVQEMRAQEASVHQEVPLQDAGTKEVPAQEMRAQEVPSQEMHEEVHSQEMHSKEASKQEVYPQGAVAQEENNKEVVGSEEQCQEMVAGEKHCQEVVTQEMHPSEAQMQEMHPPELQTQKIHHPESQTWEMQSPEAETREMHLPEAQTQEMHFPEAHTHDMHHQKTQVQDVHSEEVQAQIHEMHQQEVQTYEMHHQEVQTQDMHHQEFSQEIHHYELSQEIQPYEGHHQDLPMLSIGDGLSDFDVYISEISSSQHLKSELDQYLEESLLPRMQEFDVLGWWKLNKMKYPTLSKMAADILSIPISTVGPDSVFDTGNKKIDSYRSSLQPVTIEALVCAKDWLQYGSQASSLENFNAIVKMEY